MIGHELRYLRVAWDGCQRPANHDVFGLMANRAVCGSGLEVHGSWHAAWPRQVFVNRSDLGDPGTIRLSLVVFVQYDTVSLEWAMQSMS